MGFASVDALINAISVNGKMQRLLFDKTLPSTTVANIPHTFWKATGQPAAGADPTVGAANGRVPTSTTTGALTYTNATGPSTMAMITLGMTSKLASGNGTFILCDRLSDIQLTHVQATTALTGVTGTSRLGATTAPGDGGQIWTEVTSALSAASNTKTLTYTNQLGTTGRVTQSIITVASAVVGRSCNAKLWQSLASGDTGVRAVSDQTHSAGSATGQLNYVLVRPLATIPVPVVGLYVERDFVVEMPNIPLIYDSSCLFLICVPAGAVVNTIFGELRICEN